MRKRLVYILSLTCMFLISGVTISYAATDPDPDQMAVCLDNGFLGDSAVVSGSIYSANGNVSFTNSGSNAVSGSIYHKSGTQFTIPEWYKPDFASRVVELPNTVFDGSIPELISAPVITNYVDKYIPAWETEPLTVSENTHFGTLNIGKPITVDVSNKDIYIVVDKLSCEWGQSITLKGNGRLFLFIDSFDSPNPLNINNGSSPDKVYIFSKSSISNDNLNLYAHVYYSGLSSIKLDGAITGSVVTDAPSLKISGGGDVVNGLVYAPNAAATVESSGRINGRLVADSLTLQGMGYITYNSAYAGLAQSLPVQVLKHQVQVKAYPAECGTVSPSSVKANYGETIQVTATPKEGYRFTGFISSDVTMIPDANGYVKITGPLKLSANFEPQGEYANGLLGEYYDMSDMDNASALKMKRIDSKIAFNFMYDAPDPAIEPETFSIRWTGYIKPQVTGDYIFKTLSDDGIRVTINGANVIDKWGALSLDYTVADSPVHLEAGTYYPITFEYQQLPLYAAAFLFWESDSEPMSVVPESAFYVGQDVYNEYKPAKYYNQLDTSGTGLKNTFYTLDEDGKHTQEYTEVNNVDYVWGEGAPDGITEDVFYGEMEGYLEAKYTESTTLIFTVDDGVKVWIDGEEVISAWDLHSMEDMKYTFDTVAGQKYKIRIEYADFVIAAACVMQWESEGLGRCEVVPKEYLFEQ